VCWALSLDAFQIPGISNIHGEWLGCSLAGQVGLCNFLTEALRASLLCWGNPSPTIVSNTHDKGMAVVPLRMAEQKYTHTLWIDSLLCVTELVSSGLLATSATHGMTASVFR